MLNNSKDSSRGTEKKKKAHAVNVPEGSVVPSDQVFVEDIDGGRVQMRMREQFMSKKDFNSQEENKNQKVANPCPRCTLPLASIPSPPAETLLSKHVRSSNNTERTQLSKQSKDQHCANETHTRN